MKAWLMLILWQMMTPETRVQSMCERAATWSRAADASPELAETLYDAIDEYMRLCFGHGFEETLSGAKNGAMSFAKGARS